MNLFMGSLKLPKAKRTTQQFIFYLICPPSFSLLQMKMRLGVKTNFVGYDEEQNQGEEK